MAFDTVDFQSTTLATPPDTTKVKVDRIASEDFQIIKVDAGAEGLSVPVVAGQQVMAASVPVVIASNQTAIPVSGSFTPSGTQNVDPVANTIGLATGAKQDTGNTALTTINTTLGSPFQAGGAISNTAFTANAGTNLNTSSLALESSLSSLNAKVTAVNTGAVVVASGSITAVQPTGTNLHVVVDSGTVTATVASTTVTGNVTVVQGTGTNLHTVIDSGTTTVTQATGTNLHVVTDATSTTAVTQATATNLKAEVIGTGTFAVQTTSDIPGTGATNLGKAEDNGHTTGDTGVFALAVRNDSPRTAVSNTDADYTQISVSAVGSVRTAPPADDFAVVNSGGVHVKKYYTNAGAVTDGIVWSPAANTRWYVTDIFIGVSAAATVTLEDDLSGGDAAVFKMEFAANSGWNHTFSTPWFSGEDAADLIVTTTAGNIYITITGYEI